MKMECWSPVADNPQEQQLLDVAQSALDRARAMGASAAEASLGHGQGMSVTVRNDDVEASQRPHDKPAAETLARTLGRNGAGSLVGIGGMQRDQRKGGIADGET